MAKLTMEHFEATSKWEPEKWIIDNDPLTNKNPVSDMVIERESDGRLMISVGLDAEYYNGDPARLRQTVTDLLDGNNITNYEIEQSSHRNLSSLRIKGAEAGDLTRLIGAFSSSVDKEDRSTAYSIIDKSVAIEVADIERDIFGETGAFSVNRIPLSDHGMEYLDYESNIPGSAVTMLQQDGQKASVDGKDVTAERTNIVFDSESKSQIIKALRDVNADFVDGKEVIRVNEPIHEVANALSRAGLLPKSANGAIAKEFAEVRSEFTRVGDVQLETERILAARATMKPVGT